MLNSWSVHALVLTMNWCSPQADINKRENSCGNLLLALHCRICFGTDSKRYPDGYDLSHFAWIGRSRDLWPFALEFCFCWCLGDMLVATLKTMSMVFSQGHTLLGQSGISCHAALGVFQHFQDMYRSVLIFLPLPPRDCIVPFSTRT